VHALGIDALYVVTGERSRARTGARKETETLLMLQSRGIYPDGEGGGRVTSAGLALLLDYAREAKNNRATKLTVKELQKVASFVPKDAREWLLQPVALTPYQDGKSNHLLLIFRKRTPVSVVWKLGPFPGQIASRIDLTTDSELPLRSIGDEDDDEVRWVLDLALDGAIATVLNGVELRANTIPVEHARHHVAELISEARGNTVTIGGDVGQVVNGDQTVTAPVTFNVGSKRK
jgi:ABC-type transporter Mla MlaB component